VWIENGVENHKQQRGQRARMKSVSDSDNDQGEKRRLQRERHSHGITRATIIGDYEGEEECEGNNRRSVQMQ